MTLIDDYLAGPQPLITLRLMTDIALGSEEESIYYFNEFKRSEKHHGT